jgi:hypothetical protein
VYETRSEGPVGLLAKVNTEVPSARNTATLIAISACVAIQP